MKITRLNILFIICSIFFGCKNNSDNIDSLKTIGSANPEIEQTKKLSITNYEKEATKIIESGKSKLRDLLPNIIQGQIELYSNTLSKIEHQSIISHSYQESLIEINKIRQITTDSLLIDELKVNRIYYETINELSILNQKYTEHNGYMLNDFYDVKPFILAEDVVLKIDELIIDEKNRVKKEKRKKRDNKISIATNLLALIPSVGQISGVLGQIVKDVRIIRSNIKATNMTKKLFKDKIAPFFIKKISNSEKRAEITTNILSGRKGFLINESMIIGSEFIDNKELQKTASFFKSPDNKQPGRIMDFTDGILTQPIANLRRIMKENIEIMNKNSVIHDE